MLACGHVSLVGYVPFPLDGNVLLYVQLSNLAGCSLCVPNMFMPLCCCFGHLRHVARLQGAPGFNMIEQPINFLSWNVRGLNCTDRCSTVNATIASSSCHVVCLQGTKLDNVD